MMDRLHHVAGAPHAAPVLAASDAASYCPSTLLASFALLMAGHGRCVVTDMMLGDREYAMRQLACARALDDPELDAVARRLHAWFAERAPAGMA